MANEDLKRSGYFSRLPSNGALVLNITNRYLDLAPVAAAAAASLDWPARMVRSAADPARNLYAATWIAVTRSQRLLYQLASVPQHNGHPLEFGAVRLSKAYVGFHLMEVYRRR